MSKVWNQQYSATFVVIAEIVAFAIGLVLGGMFL